MEQIILDGAMMETPEQTQQYLRETLTVPEYYGENLDALYDVLTSITSETSLVLINSANAQENLGDYAERLFCVLEDAAVANDNLMLELA